MFSWFGVFIMSQVQKGENLENRCDHGRVRERETKRL